MRQEENPAFGCGHIPAKELFEPLKDFSMGHRRLSRERLV
jgi:hypothetical protein